MFSVSQSICAVIVTHGRMGWLTRCVRSLAQAAGEAPQFRLKIKVLVNGWDPASKTALDVLIREVGSERLIYEVSDKALVPSAARNRLLTDIDEEWVYFVDDDAFVPVEHFKRFGLVIEQFPDAMVIGGPNLMPEGTGSIQRATDVVLTSGIGTFFSSPRYRSTRSQSRDCGEESLILCNLFVRQAALGLNPFPSNFVCAEENSMLHLMSKRGVRMIHVPELFNWHERRGSVRELFRQVLKYGRGRGQFLVRHPDGISPAHLIPGAALLYTGYAAVSLLLSGSLPGMWLLLSAIYLGLCVLSRNNSGDPSAPWWSVALFPVVHVGYGIGVFVGILSGRIPE